MYFPFLLYFSFLETLQKKKGGAGLAGDFRLFGTTYFLNEHIYHCFRS
jgi:hypothetical protein